MYKKILVPMALNHSVSEQALALAQRLKAEDGTIVAVHVLEPIPSFVRNEITEEQVHGREDAAQEKLDERVKKTGGVETVILSGKSGPKIMDYAEKTGADLIIIASHKPGIKDYFLGSTAARVVRHALCSVMIVR